MIVSKSEIKVRYAETDQMGVVYHGNYLVWMEVGRTQLIEDLGFQYAQMEEDGIISPVIDVHIQYKKPVKYGETAVVETWLEDYDGIRSVYGYRILKENGELAAEATSKHVIVKKDSFRPVSLRKHFPDWHEVYEKAKMKKE
ncbi:acyl-CoA thioester hydrolase [Bacillus oleivorans]|uniref:Acyl-CoA thioester hydrolase n=1 Tax=Bacillus oleivorans TaxID=1448271 RepID=A0A285D590_9BACI|nr:thioesterase family protein [Bacillus oleivorans]SNX74981.1 acyl-CoA thioester hydrolase [Bacillus oleivorans]